MAKKRVQAQKSEWPADKVERRPVSSLIEYARNPRIHSDAQVKQIAASITEFGFTMPCLIDEDGVLIAGHGRVLASRLLDLAEVPVIVARGWTEAQKSAYRIADNQLTLLGQWDNALLAAELGDLQLAEFDTSLLGFDAEQLAKIVAGVQSPDEFQEYGEDVPTQHCCPRCGYKWSGAADAGAEGNNAEDDAPDRVQQEEAGARSRSSAGSNNNGGGDKGKRARAV